MNTFAMEQFNKHVEFGKDYYCTDEYFKCYECGKWFNNDNLLTPLLAFAGTGVKHSPKDFICCQCVGITTTKKMPYDELGFDKDGIHKDTGRKWGLDGYDVNGFNRRGIHKITGTKFNPQGYDQDGRNKTGKLILNKNMYRFVGFIKD